MLFLATLARVHIYAGLDLPFGCGGNNSGRGVGERLKVDPVNNNIVYFGSRSDGLWRSEDFGETWKQVESFPVKGDYLQEGNKIGIMWVEFDPVNGDVYAGAAMMNGECIYRSSDGGNTWEALPANAPVEIPKTKLPRTLLDSLKPILSWRKLRTDTAKSLL